MAEIFMAETGQLKPMFRRALRDAGVVVVEVPDLTKCKLVQSTSPVPADDLLWAAVDALDRIGGHQAARAFVTNVAGLMRRNREAPVPAD
jgi:hypothetical protein